MTMQISLDGLIELADYEDCMLSPYLDSGGVKTVGIGMTKSDIKGIDDIPWDEVMSIDKACASYKKTLDKYVVLTNKALKVPVTQNQFDALVSFVYNTGDITNSVFDRVNNKESNNRIKAALLMWVNDNGRRIQGLVNRRLKEYNTFAYGVYEANGCIDLIQVDKKTHKPRYSTAKRVDVRAYFSGSDTNTKDNTNVPPVPTQTPLKTNPLLDTILQGLKRIFSHDV